MKVRCNNAVRCLAMYPRRQCGKPASYDSEFCLCEVCERKDSAEEETTQDIIRSTIRNCARCHGTHEDMLFTRMVGEPIDGKTNNYTHFATCPNTGQPVVLAVVKDKPYDSAKDTYAHIGRVRELIDSITQLLSKRAVYHDQSKLGQIEKPIFDEFTPKLKDATYGSDEYKGFLKEMKVALDHHYASNRHHPEHFEAGVNSMNLIDLIEMLCDWKAAGERHADGGSIYRSIKANEERFGMSGWLVDCLLHTAEDLGWWDGVIPEREAGDGSSGRAQEAQS